MKITNKSGERRLTWDGKYELQPGESIETSLLRDGEAEWHMRRGFEKVGKSKSKPEPVPEAEEAKEPDESGTFHRPKRRTLRRKG
jgi:hypothetical protein